MKIVQINATCGIGSTGKICVGISQVLTGENIENYILCSRGNGYPLEIPCADLRYLKLQAVKSRIKGNYGFNSHRATKRMIRELERIRPDIVHLHNVHGHDCNIDTLFRYFKEKKIKLYWTFHDCWAFTGYCSYFTMAKCEKWRTGCGNCPQRAHSSCFFDRSKAIYERKKELFTGLDLTIVTPSQWLADLVRESFLKDYPVKVIHNGIDLEVFRPMSSNFRADYGIPEMGKIILGVAFGWTARKGLDCFIELSRRLDPRQYRFVVVGSNNEIDRKLPENIISIHQTSNQTELVKLYSTADLLLNPTREDNFPTVNIEALACGTPVLTFRTGGSPEIPDENCGSVVDCDDIDALEREVVRICTDAPYSAEACVRRSKQFDKDERFAEYARLYAAT